MQTEPRNWTNEWLETDGLGGFASGTVGGIRTRRYHNLLMCATRPPAGRVVLVNGLEVWVETPAGRFALSSQRYTPDVVHPDGQSRILEFRSEPWPTWVYKIDEHLLVEQELLIRHGESETMLRWSASGAHGCRLRVRPLLSGRDYHSLHRENGSFGFEGQVRNGAVQWQPYPGLPAVCAMHNGRFDFAPEWYRNFQYDEERARGLDHVEDLASPGIFSWDLGGGEAVLVLRAMPAGDPIVGETNPAQYVREVRTAERRRRESFTSPLERAADAYIVKRGKGQTIVAGYPWFTDWGRDTFIALRGLCLATGRFDVASSILLEWAETISEGMLPNRFPDGGEAPEYNSVDASLWYIVAVHELLAVDPALSGVGRDARRKLQRALLAIVDGYAGGTRYGIHMDADGLLAAGVPGVQLTWMDAKVGDYVVTPRIGKPVEVQALWLNALRIAGQIDAKWSAVYRRSLATFQQRFWREDAGCLFDVIDVDHQWGKVDVSLRPNQIFAVGGLPYALLPRSQARRVLDTVERTLLTPLGLRSLAPGDPQYRSHYAGGVWERDTAYHQGTVWPYLMGPFVEAWLRVRGTTVETCKAAQERFLSPLFDHLATAGLGHVSEIADAEAPHIPRGCPFQAWSVGELLRVRKLLSHGVDAKPAVTRFAWPASQSTELESNGRGNHAVASPA